MRPVLRAAGSLLAVAIGLVALYLAVAIVAGAIAVNRDFAETAGGVTIYLRTNGVHAELIVPAQATGIDWRVEHPAADMRALAAPTDWVAFGWGDREFMINTPTWGDLRLPTALAALAGVGEGTMHVEYIPSPLAYDVASITISAAQYLRLADYIRASFERDAAGQPQRIQTGYGDTDAFYRAAPRYTFWFTCNEWTRRALRAAGVRSPLWAPFDVALFAHLPAHRPSPQPGGGT